MLSYPYAVVHNPGASAHFFLELPCIHASAIFLGGRSMHHRYRRFLILMLAIVWLMQPATLSLAVAQAPALGGSVSMVVTSLAIVVGALRGMGVLSFIDGTQRRVMIRGFDMRS